MAPFVEAYTGRVGTLSRPRLRRTEWLAIEERKITLAGDVSFGTGFVIRENGLLTLVENSRSKSASL
jgi:hypothetical protein